MKSTYFLAFLILIAGGCNSDRSAVSSEQSNTDAPVPEACLKMDLTSDEFGKVLVGQWISAFTYPFGANISRAEFRSDGTATITVLRNGIEKETIGVYQLEFERPPEPGTITFARVLVKSDETNLVLSRVHFGYHSGVAYQVGPVLRIGSEPRGALKRVNQL